MKPADVECVGETLTLDEMSGDGASEDKESRMFRVTRGMLPPAVICANEDQNFLLV